MCHKEWVKRDNELWITNFFSSLLVCSLLGGRTCFSAAMPQEEEEVMKAHLISQLWPFSRPVSKTEMNEMGKEGRNMHKIYSRIITQISFYFSQFVLRWDVLHRRPPKLLQIIDNEVKTRHQEEAFGGCLWSSRYSPFSCKSSSSSSFHSLWFSTMAANSTIDGIPIYLQLLLHQFSSVGLMSAIQ